MRDGSLNQTGMVKMEMKVLIDTNEDIDSEKLTAETCCGWKLVCVINSTLGRSKDRYYFERIIKQ